MERKSLEFAKSKLEELSRYAENLWKGFRVGEETAWQPAVEARVMQVSRERKEANNRANIFFFFLLNHRVKETVLNYHAHSI